MPMLEIEVVGRVPDALRSGLAQRIADEAGAIFESPPGETWVRVRELPASDYAENAADAAAAGIRPVIVRVLKRAHPSLPKMAREIEALTMAVAMETDRPPDQVHVVYEPPGDGRVAFGGKLVR